MKQVYQSSIYNHSRATKRLIRKFLLKDVPSKDVTCAPSASALRKGSGRKGDASVGFFELHCQPA